MLHLDWTRKCLEYIANIHGIVVDSNQLYLICSISGVKQFVSLLLCIHIYFFVLGKLEIVALSLSTQNIFVTLNICVHNMILLLDKK